MYSSINRIVWTFFIACPFFVFSQKMKNTERKGKFFFSAGPEYRITPTYKQNSFSREAIYTNPDLQNSGLALNIGVDYYFSNNFSIGFKNSFRYDLVTSEIDAVGQPLLGVSESKKDLLIGYHFNLNYHIDLFKKGDLLINVGVSLLNRNSEFSVTEEITDNNGQVVATATSLIDYKYSANKLSLGYGNGRSKFMLGIYITGNSGYFLETTTFIVPFLNYSFDFAKL